MSLAHAKAPKALSRDRRLLIEHLPLILFHRDTICSNPKWRLAISPAAAVELSVVGSRSIPLGVLLWCWESGVLRASCPECQDSIYICDVGASPLSGCGVAHGVCLICRAWVEVESSYEIAAKVMNSCSRSAGDDRLGGMTIERKRVALTLADDPTATRLLLNVPSFSEVIHDLQIRNGA